MSRVLVDTSGYSHALKGHADARDVIQRADLVFVNAVVLGELHAGFRRGSRRKANEDLLSRFLDSPRVQVLPVDAETAERYATILTSLHDAGTPIPTNDIWIAATAMQHGLVVLTADEHFRRVPQIIVAPLW